jgi:surfeit locus 1 family protein
MDVIIIKKLKIRLNWKIALCVALGFSVLMKLGFWQLDRANEKREIIQAIELRQSAEPVMIGGLSKINKKDFEHQRLRLQGSYNNEKNILIKRQIHQGRYGYEVITPFMVESDKHWLLVSRGWIEDQQGAGAIPVVEPVEGSVELVVGVHYPTGQAFFKAGSIATDDWPLVLSRLNLQGLSSLFDQKLYPFLVRLDEKSPGVYIRHWQPEVIKVSTNISYAMQWFLMAFLLLLIALVASSNVIELIKNR